jgi:tetratricopeptide (TPR) repeat protein
MNYNRMLNQTFARGLTTTVTTALILFSASPNWVLAAPADDIKEAQRLYQQNRLDAALSKVNGALTQTPKDALGRFLKANILIEQKRFADAIQILTGLTEDFPELPEPYNNLAALYASQGNYEKAKAALELAIHTNPSYATAHENLGDIYAQLARREYDKALSLDKSNSTAQSKLAMVKDLFQPPRVAAQEAAKAAPVQVAKADTAKATPATVAPPVIAPVVAPPATVAVAKSTATPPAQTAAITPAQPSAATDSQINALLRDWTTAWSSKDVQGYLSLYAQDFETPNGIPRKTWEAQRKQRIEAPSSIKVDAQISKLDVKGNEATVVIRQSYKSNVLSNTTSKTLKLVKSGDRWMIRSERSGA